MDLGLDQDKPELGALVGPVALEVLAHVHRLLDEVVEVLRDLRGEAVELQDAEDLGASGALDLGDTLVVTEDDTDLRRGEALLRVLEDVLLDVLGRGGHPLRRVALVGERRLGNPLALARLHTSHGCFFAF